MLTTKFKHFLTKVLKFLILESNESWHEGRPGASDLFGEEVWPSSPPRPRERKDEKRKPKRSKPRPEVSQTFVNFC